MEENENEDAIAVDWKEDDEGIVEAVAERVPGLSYVVTDDDDFLLSYRGKKQLVGLTFSMRDRYVTIRALNRILAGHYEMRLIIASAGSDTHVFYLRPSAWWRQAEHAHPEEIAHVFRVVEEDMDFS